MNWLSKRRSRTSMRLSHFTLAMPYQPGAMSRSGEAVLLGQGLAVHLVGQQVGRAHGVGDRHAAREVLRHGDVADGVVQLDGALVGAPEHDLDAVVLDPGLLEERREGGARPSGRCRRRR